MHGATILMDVLAIGRGMEKGSPQAQRGEEVGSFGGCGSVGALCQDSQTAQVGVHIGDEPVYVRGSQRVLSGDGGGRLCSRLGMFLRLLQKGENLLLDGELVGIRQLESCTSKDFDSIIGPGIVRG